MSLQLFKLNRYFYNREFVNRVSATVSTNVYRNVVANEHTLYNKRLSVHGKHMERDIHINISEHIAAYDQLPDMIYLNSMIKWIKTDLQTIFKDIDDVKIDHFCQRYKTYIRVRMTIPKNYFTIKRDYQEYDERI